MSDFPKRNSAFNPLAYRSQAAYNAHKNSLRTSDIDLHKKEPTDKPKPTVSFNPHAYRSQAAFDAHQNASRGDTNPPKKQSFDMPKRNNSFNPHGYRGQAGYNSNKDTPRAGINHPKPQFQKQQFQKQQFRKQRPTKPAEGSGTQSGADEPHYMSDAEVREWFRQADIDYENKKKAGYNKDYVPAGGHTPDFSTFRAKFSASNATVPGMKNSMHAPTPAELAKLQGHK